MVVYRRSGNPAYTTSAASPPPKLPTGPQVVQPGQQWTEVNPAGVWNNQNRTVDAHIVVSRGHEKSGRESGIPDPVMSGPIRPSARMLFREFLHQEGTDNTANLDDKTRAYARNSQGMLMGQQDGSVNVIYGGTPGLYEPYGSYQGFTTGAIKGIQAPVPAGAPGDGPQHFNSGPPHGYHTATLPDYSQTLGVYMAVGSQQVPPAARPFNSRIAGQSFSQTVAPLGQQGTTAVRVRNGRPRILTGLSGGRGWRG